MPYVVVHHRKAPPGPLRPPRRRRPKKKPRVTVQPAQQRYRPIGNKKLLSQSVKLDAQGAWPWPTHHVSASFAISIRPERFQGLQKRLGPWRRYVKMFSGTNGRAIQRQRPEWRKKIGNVRLRRGQIGCYDSHYRLWQHVARSHYKGAVMIMEDDAALFYNKEVAQRLQHLFEKLRQHNIPWHIIYLGHYSDNQAGRQVCPGIHHCRDWQGLFCYLVNKAGASILARHGMPMREPCDVFVGGLIKKGLIKALRVEPRYCYVVTTHSDTTKIK